MGKIQFCRICRTEKNLKYTLKQLREFNKQQLSSAQKTQGSKSDKASIKLLRSTPTLGNICKDCDDRIQIYHRLDDANQSSDSDIEVDVVNASNAPLPPANILPVLNTVVRPETPVIVDDDDMLYNLFMQKVDQQRQQKHLPPQITQLPQMETQHPQHFISHYNPLIITPPQSNVGSEGDDAKVIEVLTSRESTPASIERIATPTPIAPIISQQPTDLVDKNGHRIVAIIDLDDEKDVSPPFASEKIGISSGIKYPLNEANAGSGGITNNLLNFIVKSATYQTTQLNNEHIVVNTSKNIDSRLEPESVEPSAKNDDDDDEIIFSRVETNIRLSPPKKKNRKSYDDKELRLVASLSLVSSDSDSEDQPKSAINDTVIISHTRFDCQECKNSFPDENSLSVHMHVHQGIKCPVCNFGYSQEKRLIHHMRYKHRAYRGQNLTEMTRAPRDSAMTICLRFMQRTTFYECQLCGRIDETFKEHKEHIICKHPVESKKLNDPIMKELKCPLCKYKCGTQYLSLCNHLLRNHEYDQYKTHLKELIHVSSFGWNASRQQEVAKTARIYQFAKRKTFFFECKMCRKVTAGYLNHIKHNASHGNETLGKKPVTDLKSPSVKLNHKSTEKGNVNGKDSKLAQVFKSTKSLKKIKHKITQKDASKASKKHNLKTTTKTKTLKKSLKSTKVATTAAIQKANKASSKKTTETIVKESIFKKPKSINTTSKDKNSNTNTKSRKAIEIVDQSMEKSNNAKKRSRVKEESVTKTKLKKVKVKPVPIKLISLQTYKCNYCPKKIKGFRLFNLHLLNDHKKDEYKHCLMCRKAYFNCTITLQNHSKECANVSKSCSKQKRKYVKPLATDANCNSMHETQTKNVGCTRDSPQESKPLVPDCKTIKRMNNEIIPALENTDNETMWLKDLLKLHAYKNSSNKICSDKDKRLTNSNNVTAQPLVVVVQCCYCLHLFNSNLDLQEHVRLQHACSNVVLMKYKPPFAV